MKILLSGAQGTGKSTLVKKYKTSLTKIDSMSKLFIDNKGIQTDIHSSGFIDFEYRITLYHLNNLINMENIICSRNFSDSWAFCTYAFKNSDNRCVRGAMKDLIKIIEHSEFISRSMDIKHIYVPIKFKITQDNNQLRIIDEVYQQKIDDLILQFFDKRKIKYLELKCLGVNERIKEIEDYAKNS